MCGFVTPLQGSEADEHRKPEVAGEWAARVRLSTQRFPSAVGIGCEMGFGEIDHLGCHPSH